MNHNQLISGWPFRTPEISLTGYLIDGTFIGFQDSNTGITQYRGVRYADPPVGALRWQAPVFPPSQHLGQVNATKVIRIIHHHFYRIPKI